MCKFKRLVCKSLPVRKVKAKRQNHTSLHLVPLSPRDLRDVAWSRKTRTSRRRHASLRCTLVVLRGVVASRYFTSNLPWIQEFKWIWSLQEPPFFLQKFNGCRNAGEEKKCFSNKPWANPPWNDLLPAMQMRSPWKRTQANKERKKPKPTILGRPVIPCAVPSKSEKWMIEDDCLSKCSCFFCSFDELTIGRTSSRITTSVPFPQSELCYKYFILTDPWTKNLLHRQGTSSSNKSLEAKPQLPGVGFNDFFKTKWANLKSKRVIHSKWLK